MKEESVIIKYKSYGIRKNNYNYTHGKIIIKKSFNNIHQKKKV